MIVCLVIMTCLVVFHQRAEEITSVTFIDSDASSFSTGHRIDPNLRPASSTVSRPAERVNSFPRQQQERYSKFHYRPAQPRTNPSIDPECGQPPTYQSYFAQSQMFRSSRHEDRILYELFFLENESSLSNNNNNRSHDYRYVELGAFNGKRESNTRFFDLCLHWDGLLIEANPLKYPKLLENRPHAHCLNYAPSCRNDDDEPNKGDADSTTMRMIPFHSVAFTNAAQADVPNHYDNTTLVQVPCDEVTPPLLDILDGYVTLFSLDVEGAENQVLRTVDFSKVHVDIWMVETVNQFCQREEPCESRDESRAILHRAGYMGFQDVVYGSDIFVLPSSEYHKILSSRFDPTMHRIKNITLG